jgi:disulfide bond formation protein DsbB
MSNDRTARNSILNVGRILCVMILAAAILLSGRFATYFDPFGLFFIILGGAAGALMTFSGGEIKAAFALACGARGSPDELCRSVLFWEAAARNFWILGILRSILSFVVAVGSLTGGLAGLTLGLANSLLAALYGMVLTAICYVPYWKLAGQHHHALPAGRALPSAAGAEGEFGRWKFSHIAGYAIFVALLLSTILMLPKAEIGGALKWIVYWPSLLVVFGGTLALLLFLGNTARESAISPAFAVTGLIGTLTGFIQTLLGLAAGNIETVASAVTFILSSCFAALLGMFLVGAPLEDRAAKRIGELDRSPLSRAAWYVFPLMALLFLVAVFLLVVTPFERHQ